jgi:hypothetical protein
LVGTLFWKISDAFSEKLFSPRIHGARFLATDWKISGAHFLWRTTLKFSDLVFFLQNALSFFKKFLARSLRRRAG